MAQKGFVLFTEKEGVFIGHALGMSFWSKLEPAGQESAIAFETEEKARFFAKGLLPTKEEVKLIPVEVDYVPGKGHYASMEACVESGIPFWNSYQEILN